MQRRNGITIIEVIVIIIVSIFLTAIFMPPLGKEKPIARRVVCGTNLKGLGTACSVYANDYEDRFPQLPGIGPWSKKLGFSYDQAMPDFKKGGEQNNVDRTITASWFLLVREADVSPKSFVCKEEGSTAFEGTNSKYLDLVQLWDFGAEPHKHVSYTMHDPYGNYPAKGNLPANFALGADMSPWFHLGDIVPPDTSNSDWRKNRILLPPYFSESSIPKEKIQQSNVMVHKREGQNVMFADGHSEYVKMTDVGVKHDNIYTFWSNVLDSIGLGEMVEKESKVPDVSEADKRIGTNPTSRSKDNDAKSAEDSFLSL